MLFIKLCENLPSAESTYPTWGSLENHGLKSALVWDMLISRRVVYITIMSHGIRVAKT